MIKFRQKIFFAPLAALGGGSAIMGAFNVGSTAIGVGGMVQAHNQGKQQEEMNDQNLKMQERQAKQMEEQMKAQNKALQAIADNASKNPMAANQTIDIMSMKSFSNKRKSRQRLFSGTWSKYWDAAKEGGKILWNNYKGGIADMAAFGVGMAGVGYAVDRYIQSDKAKKGEAVEGTLAWKKQQKRQSQQRSYSGGESIMKNVKSSVVMGGVLGLFPLLSYKMGSSSGDKQVNNTTGTGGSTNANVSGPNTPQQRNVQQRSYSGGSGWFSKAWKRFKSHPGQSLLGFANHLVMGGGQAKSFKVGRQLRDSSNELVSKAGKWALDHPKTLVAATMAPAAVAMGVGEYIGEKPVKAAIGAVDKDAFAYEKSQNAEVY
jgi:hypothetical protein